MNQFWKKRNEEYIHWLKAISPIKLGNLDENRCENAEVEQEKELNNNPLLPDESQVVLDLHSNKRRALIAHDSGGK